MSLRYNEHGGVIIRQSDLSSWARCQLQKKYYDDAPTDPSAPQPIALSATVFGTVVHYALLVLEKRHRAGVSDALATAVATFEHYWNPKHIDDIAEQVQQWLPRQTYGGMMIRGRNMIESYYELLRKDDGKLLALEYQFAVPIVANGRQHTLTGTIDRLAVRKFYGTPYLAIEDFKGLPTGTPIPTPDGWTPMRNLQVGDQVFGADGKPCNVIATSAVHFNPCYRITFDSGESVVADHEHLWQVETDGGTKVIATEDLPSNLVNPVTGQRHLRILNAEALNLPDADLPVEPYVLGAWLGDGTRGRGSISKPDQALFDNIEDCGYKVGPPDSLGTSASRTVYGLSRGLRALGVIDSKQVPGEYLRASRRQRLALLQGLMDTDGTWNKKRRRAVFTTCDPALADSVYELVSSLGWRASRFAVTRHGFGKTVEAHDVTFAPLHWNPFRLPRKADLVDTLDGNGRSHRLLIRDVEPCDMVATRCIQVDSPDSLYLFGESMIPTHNTGKQPTYLRHNVQGTAYAYATTQPEFWTNPDFEGFDEATLGGLEKHFAKHRYQLHEGTQETWWSGVGETHMEGLAGRRFRWVNMYECRHADGGWRDQQDYAKLRWTIDAYVRAVEADIYSPTLTGEICVYCPFQRSCMGVGIPDHEVGMPRKRYGVKS